MNLTVAQKKTITEFANLTFNKIKGDKFLNVCKDHLTYYGDLLVIKANLEFIEKTYGLNLKINLTYNIEFVYGSLYLEDMEAYYNDKQIDGIEFNDINFSILDTEFDTFENVILDEMDSMRRFCDQFPDSHNVSRKVGEMVLNRLIKHFNIKEEKE